MGCLTRWPGGASSEAPLGALGGSQGSSSEGSRQSPIPCRRLAPSVHAGVWLPGRGLRGRLAFLLTVVCLQPLVLLLVPPSHSRTSLPVTPGVTSPFACPLPRGLFLFNFAVSRVPPGDMEPFP